jgi:methylthioribose-1-phosphate isomerase
MTLPLLTYYATILRYDAARGVLTALDRRVYPDRTVFVECGDVAAVARAIETLAIQGGPSTAYAGGYGLALAARAWRGRPSEAQRGAIIQASQLLREAAPRSSLLARIVEQGLARADAAILAGNGAEGAVVSFIHAEVSRADRVAERCGRIAAGLVDDGDRLLAYGFAGSALNWMLYAAYAEQNKQIRASTVALPPAHSSARLAAQQAAEIGVPVIPLANLRPEQVFAGDNAVTLYIAGAERVALDGSVAGAAGAGQYAEQARGYGLPVYILGYDGPERNTATAADLLGAAGEDIDMIAPALISAIVTSRGIYRPEMIARHLGDGDAPLDVIPLQS